MVIDVDAPVLSLGQLVSHGGQCSQGGLVQRLEGGLPAAFELLERPRIELVEQLPDGLVQFIDAEEFPVAQARQDPALYDLHPYLDLGFVFRFPRPRR
jgi:hypothetical protein